MTKTTDLANVRDFVKTLGELTQDNTMPSQQVTLLLSLAVHGTTSQSALEDVTGVKRSSNSRNISKLGVGESAWSSSGPGYVENYEDPANRRTKMVRLTPKGQALLDECWNRTFNKIKRNQDDATSRPLPVQTKAEPR